MARDPLTWVALFGLVATAAPACSGGTGNAPGTSTSSSSSGGSGTSPGTSSGSSTKPTYPAGHPCEGKGNCDTYIRLPDGGAAPAGSTDAGTTAMCGPCNG